MTTMPRTGSFYGWRVAGAACVLAGFGWGMGFYGPPVFLSVLQETRGWPVAMISAAVTVHFLVGALTSANLRSLHRRYGPAKATRIAGVCLAAGCCGWAVAGEAWQLFLAALPSGLGWGAMSASAINAIVSPWFVRSRPAALGMAYNGASIGGIIFSPLWVAGIGVLGFPAAAAAIGLTMVLVTWTLAYLFFAQTPEQMGLVPDGDTPHTSTPPLTSPAARPLPGRLLWGDRRFLTLSAGMSLGLFAQIGLVAHLFSLLLPALGAQGAGFAMALVTAMAIAGRTLIGRLMPIGVDRRLVACGGYAAQLAGSITLAAAAGTSVPLLMLGVVLFGVGFGNATSLPPLIAQVEFVIEDVQRVVSLMVGIAQGAFAFAPAVFGLVRGLTSAALETSPGAAPYLFAVAGLVQACAIAAFLTGRRR